MVAGILMFDPDIGVFRNGHVLREHDFIDVAHDGSWPDC